jgi:hypothetical protein
MTRALYAAYDGPLYSVRRADTNATANVKVVAAGGAADAQAQDTFCKGTSCTIQTIFDQSALGNDLSTAPPGGAAHQPDKGCTADHDRQVLGGRTVYGAFFEGGMGYRRENTKGVATGDDPESMYAVFGGKHYNTGCCFDCAPTRLEPPPSLLLPRRVESPIGASRRQR